MKTSSRFPLSRFLAFAIFGALAFSLQPSAFGSQITVDVTITNAPTYGNTWVLNGDTRSWVTNTPAARQMQIVTNSVSACATNFFNSIATTPFSNGVMVLQPSSNVVRLVGPASLAMTASLPDTSWGYFTSTTNTSFTMTGLRLPLANEPSASVRTNLATLLVDGINAFSSNRFLLGVLPLGVITNAQEQLDAVTGRVGTLEGRTNLWNGAVTNAGSGLVLSGRDLAVDWAMNKLTNDTFYTSLADFGLTNAAVAAALGGKVSASNGSATNLSVVGLTAPNGITLSNSVPLNFGTLNGTNGLYFTPPGGTNFWILAP